MYLKVDRSNITNASLDDQVIILKLTDAQADMMLHAIGADNKKAARYRYNNIYHAYRNYYDAGGTDIETWNEITDLGLADRQGTYFTVNSHGLKILEVLTSATIFSDIDCVADCRMPALNYLMLSYVMDKDHRPVSAMQVSQYLHVSYQIARDTVTDLLRNGFVDKVNYSGYNEDTKTPFCFSGYTITQKTKDLDRFKTVQDNFTVYLKGLGKK